MDQEDIKQMRDKAMASCTTYDTMRDFVRKSCDELLKMKVSQPDTCGESDKKSKIKWTYKSADAYRWTHGTFDTKAEAVEAALDYAEEMGLEQVIIGRCVMQPLPEHIIASKILDDLNFQYKKKSNWAHDGNLYEEVKIDDLQWLEQEISKVIHRFHERAEIKSIQCDFIKAVYSLDVE